MSGEGEAFEGSTTKEVSAEGIFEERGSFSESFTSGEVGEACRGSDAESSEGEEGRGAPLVVLPLLKRWGRAKQKRIAAKSRVMTISRMVAPERPPCFFGGGVGVVLAFFAGAEVPFLAGALLLAGAFPFFAVLWLPLPFAFGGAGRFGVFCSFISSFPH